MLKAADAIRSALSQMAVDNEWLSLREYVSAVSWTGNVAEIPVVTKVYNVMYQVPAQPATELIWLPVTDSAEVISPSSLVTGVPQYWTVLTESQIRISPEPTFPEYVQFYVLRPFFFPETLENVFNMPEGLIPLLVLKATEMLALSHLGSAQLASEYASRYEQQLRRLQSFYRGTPSEYNMFRRNINYGARYFRGF